MNQFFSNFDEESSTKIENEVANPLEDGANSLGIVSEFFHPVKKGDSHNASCATNTLNDINRRKEFERPSVMQLFVLYTTHLHFGSLFIEKLINKDITKKSSIMLGDST